MKFAISSVVAALVIGVPGTVEAQASDWWDWALREAAGVQQADTTDGRTLGDIIFGRDGRASDRDDRDDRDDRRDRDDDDDDDRYEDRGRGERGAGPPFCRSGAGHPVHGQQWCRDKGFGLGSRQSDARWERDRSWEDIIIGAPRDRDRRSDTVDQGGLIDILGDVVLGRTDRERRRTGATGPLEGRWLRLNDGGRVLQIRSGSLPLVELTDLDGDGRVDVAMVPMVPRR